VHRAGDDHRQRQQIATNRIEDEAEGFECQGAEQRGVGLLGDDHRRGPSMSLVEEERVAAIAIDGGPIRQTNALSRVGVNPETLEHPTRHEPVDGTGVHEELDCLASIKVCPRRMRARAFWRTVTADTADLLQRFLRLLADEGIRHCLIGGQAVNAYVEPVVSLDLDIAVAPGDWERLEAALAESFTAERLAHSVNVVDPASDLRIGCRPDPRYAAFVPHAEEREVLGVRVPVARPQDPSSPPAPSSTARLLRAQRFGSRRWPTGSSPCLGSRTGGVSCRRALQLDEWPRGQWLRISPPGGSPLGTRAGIARSKLESVRASRNAMMSCI
jgi:hypothetical protein